MTKFSTHNRGNPNCMKSLIYRWEWRGGSHFLNGCLRWVSLTGWWFIRWFSTWRWYRFSTWSWWTRFRLWYRHAEYWWTTVVGRVSSQVWDQGVDVFVIVRMLFLATLWHAPYQCVGWEDHSTSVNYCNTAFQIIGSATCRLWLLFHNLIWDANTVIPHIAGAGSVSLQHASFRPCPTEHGDWDIVSPSPKTRLSVYQQKFPNCCRIS